MFYLKPQRALNIVEEKGEEVEKIREKLVIATPQNCQTNQFEM